MYGHEIPLRNAQVNHPLLDFVFISEQSLSVIFGGVFGLAMDLERGSGMWLVSNVAPSPRPSPSH